LIKQVGDLPPIPQVAQKALSLIRNPNSDMGDLAGVLSLDQGMTSTVLKWVNSPYYGLAQQVSTVQQAVVYLGQTTIQNLILAASVSTLLYRPVPGYGLERGDLWKHSIGVANGAQILANHFGEAVASEAYHAGLLCDIGKLAFEVLMRKVDLDRVNWQGKPFSDLEVEVFGFDHAHMGAAMAAKWNLPESLQKAIEFHHSPALAGEHMPVAAAIHIADAAMMMFGIGVGSDGLRYNLDPNALAILGLKEENIPTLFDQMVNQISTIQAYLGLAQ
jgi:putative nucleotidyltransferase with HDIG domain